MIQALDWLIVAIKDLLGTDAFLVRSAMAIILVSLVCGSVGSLVVGNRMAFFSDALAHCALAGVTLGILTAFLVSGRQSDEMMEWLVPLIMIGFGIVVGISIAFVRERTALASDTVIGVFFAGAIGVAGILFSALRRMTNQDPETFLFGGPNFVTSPQLLALFGLLLVTAIILVFRYNQLVFASFNPSLARSRQIPLRLYNYLFISLLAFIVNLSIQAVGALLINAMLIVPAATASNLSRNMRQMFWWTITLSLFTGLAGEWISSAADIRFRGVEMPLGASGCIVVLNVFAFALSMLLMPVIRGRQTR